MKNENDVLQRLKEKEQLQSLQKEEQLFDTGFQNAQKFAPQESLDQSSVESFEEKKLSENIQEVRREHGVRELKGEIPAGPKYIGFDKKFTRIEDEDSSRMIAVKEALKAYHKKDREVTDRVALDNLIAACNAYCKGRFAFFKAFRKAGVRLAEVKALRAEATEMRDALLAREEKSELIYEEAKQKSSFRTYTSMSTKLKSKTYQKEEESLKADAKALEEGDLDADAFDEDAYMDEGYENEEEVKSLKEQLIEEYGKKEPDPDTLENLEQDLWKRTEEMLKFNTYLKVHYPDSVFMEDHAKLDMELAKLRIPYQDKLSKKKIEEEADKEDFKEELKDMALENYDGDFHMDDADLQQRDKAYSEKELKKLLKEFESFDLAQVSFSNPLDIIRNYRQNAVVFEHVRSVHYQVFRGIHHGFSMDDEQIIKLRAKFLAAFEMQEYMVQINYLAAKGKLDLTKSPEEIKEQVRKELNKNHINRIVPDPGDPNAFLAKCEEKLREEYDHREEFIEKIVHVIDYGGDEDETVPGSKIRKKAKAYEKNALMYDYFQRREIRTNQVHSDIRTEYYNEKRETELKPINGEISRMHGNFLFGKSNEERVRLTNLQGGTAEERLEYYKEVLRSLKSFDLKELDLRNLTEFYENFERKEVVMQLYTNSSTIAKEVVKALEEIRKKEHSNIPKLPEDFKKEFGYEDLDAFIKDMYVSNEIGNTIQTKLDSICQSPDFGFLGAFSLKELFTIDAKEYDKMYENLQNYESAVEQKTLESFAPDKGSVDYFIDDIVTQLNTINIPIQTRPLTKEEKKEGKKQQRMTMDVSIFDILEEEKEAYDVKNRKKQTQKAKEKIAEVEEIYRSADHLAKEIKAEDTNQRLLKGYAGPMSYFFNDTEEKKKERMKALMPDPKTATHEEKEAMARELEDSFRLIMEFDLSRLNMEKLTDLLNGDYKDAMVMSKFCFEFNALFDQYKDLIKDETVNTKLDMNDFQEVKAKKEFFLTYQSMLGQLLGSCFGSPLHEKYDANKILQWESGKKITEALEDPEIDPQYSLFLNNISFPYEAMKKYGYGPGVDMNKLYEKNRVKDYGAPAEDHRAELKKKLG